MTDISIGDLVGWVDARNRISSDNDFCIMDFKYGGGKTEFSGFPCRVDGFIAIFCISGEFTININMDEYAVKKDTLLLSVPMNIINSAWCSPEQLKDLHFIMVAISSDYLSGLNIDGSRVLSDGMQMMRVPSIVMNREEKAIGESFLLLADKIMKYPFEYRRQSLRGVVSSLTYFIVDMCAKRQEVSLARPWKPGERNRTVTMQFIKLVSEYHHTERTVLFYADKMCLTPKYLSKLVKSATGRSAPDWIDSYVILEIKNMLKYSNMPIKEIAARLNFSNQSVFHKYFRAHTGMTPVQYRNNG
ncbi:MAG: helix-turn-helix domain-containing protein [Candidatus Cryptobacteroides sp.]